MTTNKQLLASLSKVEKKMKKDGEYLGNCPFSPYDRVDGFGRPVGGCSCGGGIDTYDGECTCCGSMSCSSKRDCLRIQRDKLVWQEHLKELYDF